VCLVDGRREGIYEGNGIERGNKMKAEEMLEEVSENAKMAYLQASVDYDNAKETMKAAREALREAYKEVRAEAAKAAKEEKAAARATAKEQEREILLAAGWREVTVKAHDRRGRDGEIHHFEESTYLAPPTATDARKQVLAENGS